jgi:PKD repeat protein
MRSIGLLAVVTGTLVLATACSDGAGTSPPENTAPVAKFDVPACTINQPCPFASTSTDDAEVTGWSWDFDGDGHADATTAAASFTYATAGDFNVSLTVRDAQGLSNTKTSTITIDPAPPGNPSPTAGFTYSCIAVDCAFTSTSTDVAPGTIATYAWTLGDGATAEVKNPSHRYTLTAPTDFIVTLTVSDNEGATDVETQTITVTPAPVRPPAAGFTYTCTNVAKCSFTSTIDITPGTIPTYAWTFGDGGTAAVSNPSHTYAITVPTDFTVTLTVTDNVGGSAVVTQTVTATPPPPVAEGCAISSSSPKIVECALNIPARSTVKLKLLGISCVDRGQKVTAAPPIGDQVFLSVCLRTVGEELGIFGGPLDERIVYEAGSQLRIWFTQGTSRSGEPPVAPPAATFTGTFPDWTINFEDGANPGGTGEPDFTDVVVGVHATEVR